MDSPLYVAFVWHMHQPYYRDTETGEYLLPWVRLHAVKDYLHVAEVIAQYPTVHQTINVVPSLAEQLLDYAEGKAQDQALAVSQKAAVSASRLTPDDKRFVLRTFFSINWDHFVTPNPRYALLARLREAAGEAVELFSDEFWYDLIVWYNLAWVDPSTRLGRPALRRLVEQGKSFGPSDVAALLAEHRAICGEVIPTYRRLAEAGQVELTTSPSYHPILPLLIDTTVAREASPGLPLPHLRFQHPEDARAQLADAVAFHQRTFGRAPQGLWPPEGAISARVVQLVGSFPNFHWLASDEHVLERALRRGFERDSYGHLRDPRPLYRPYRLKSGGPVVFFRDQVLSDRVGFVYQHWESRDAANDLVERLLHAQRTLADQENAAGPPPIVAVVLDGENCWEFYPNNGDDFLRALFERLAGEPALRAVTPGEYLSLHPGIEAQLPRLDRLVAGSWIGGNLETWIGEPDQNRAWEYLARTRNDLATWQARDGQVDSERSRRAWHALLIAEGSDWFWWYYSRNRLAGEQIFDVQFRRKLANVYRASGAPPPDWLERPISQAPPPRHRDVQGPMALAHLASGPEASPEWAMAGYVEPEGSAGTMQVGAHAFRRFYFGSGPGEIYFRIELTAVTRPGEIAILGRRGATAPALSAERRSDQREGPGRPTPRLSSFDWRIDLAPSRFPSVVARHRRDDGTWTEGERRGEIAISEVAAELRVPWKALGLSAGDPVEVVAAIVRDEEIVETTPTNGLVRFRVGEAADDPALAIPGEGLGA